MTYKNLAVNKWEYAGSGTKFPEVKPLQNKIDICICGGLSLKLAPSGQQAVVGMLPIQNSLRSDTI